MKQQFWGFVSFTFICSYFMLNLFLAHKLLFLQFIRDIFFFYSAYSSDLGAIYSFSRSTNCGKFVA